MISLKCMYMVNGIMAEQVDELDSPHKEHACPQDGSEHPLSPDEPAMEIAGQP
jgi:hypothetical protein